MQEHKNPIYLDYAAHTPADERVLEVFVKSEGERAGSANSRHSAGYAAKSAIDRATEEITDLLRLQNSEIIYTSGASESNNLAVKGAAKTSRHLGRHIITAPFEHPSVSGALSALKEQGYDIEITDILSNGKVDVNGLSERLRDDTVLVCLCAVDSELGIVQPVNSVKEVLSGFPHCRLLVDATQAIGKIPFDCDGIDFVSFSAHKFFGICGSGVLVKNKDAVIEPLVHGGESTSLYRSGTPAVSLAVSLAFALSLSLRTLKEDCAYVEKLNGRLRRELSRCAGVKVRFNSPPDAVPHILNLSVKGIKGAEFQRMLDEAGVCVSVKSACSPPDTPSRSVFAISRDKKNALSSWRISLSARTAEDEIDRFIKIFTEVVNGTRV